MNDSDHATDALAYSIMSGVMDVVPSHRKLMDWIVPPTLYCFMLLFVSLTLYAVLSKFIDGMISISQGLLIQ
jgi:hypothetical protein